VFLQHRLKLRGLISNVNN